MTRHAYERSADRLDDSTMDALKLYQAFLSMNAPRLLKSALPAQWFIFTDASHEPDSESPASGLGGVLVDAKGQCVRFYSELVSVGLLEQMNVSHKKTIVFELEFLAIWCAFCVWAHQIESSPVVVFTDNDAVRDSLIGCRTSSDNASIILEACLRREFSLALNLWVARVPTDSNIADEPSRNSCDGLLRLGAIHDSLDLNEIWQQLENLTKGGGNDQQLRPQLTYKKKCAWCERSQLKI